MSPFDSLHPAVQHHIVNSLGWRGLRPMQERAIEPILAGTHVLVLAPTAGGKTEAAVLPLLSRMLAERWTGLSVLYVCPIKALLNNLEPRLARLAELVGRRAALWHGDVGAGARRRMVDDPPDLLLTTPESIEAMLISTRTAHADLFADLRVVVVDELHAFAGDDRGWHLLALLERLGRISGRPLQRVGLSATVGNPAELLDWLAGHTPGKRSVLAPEAVPTVATADVKLDHVGSLDSAALVIARLHRGEKRLVFCDSRSRTEELASMLRGHGVRTFVSHSSLSQDERRQAEAAFGEGSDCVIVATSTLELGIDVGDLDRVIQIDAPSSVASFLQRLGRTGRCAGTRRNALFLATSADAFLRAAAIILLWAEGFVEPVRPPPNPWHLFAQQVMALALQERHLAFDALPAWIGALPAFRGPEAAVLAHMTATGVLAEDGGILSIGREGERRFGRRHFLDLVAAFATPPLFQVRFGRQELGQVHALSFAGPETHPRVLLLAGRGWAVKTLDWNARVAWVEPSREAGRSRWNGSSRAMDASLARAVRRVLAGADLTPWLSRRACALINALREDYAWSRDGATALVRDDQGRQSWWTFAGQRANAVLSAALDDSGLPVRRYDNIAIAFAGSIERARLSSVFTIDLAMLHPTLSAEATNDLKFGACLPSDLLEQIVASRWYDWETARAVLQEPMTEVDLIDC